MSTYTKCTTDADCKSITAAQNDACCTKTTLVDWIAGGLYDSQLMKDSYKKTAEETTNLPPTKGSSVNICAISKAIISVEIEAWKKTGIEMKRECLSDVKDASTFVSAVMAIMTTAIAYGSF